MDIQLKKILYIVQSVKINYNKKIIRDVAKYKNIKEKDDLY